MASPLYSLHLFAGAGGGLLADRLSGIEPVVAVEIEEFPRRILALRWPRLAIWDDVRTFRADNPDCADAFAWLREHAAELVVAGGFPCQDISAAGTGRGLEGERSGLWREFARVLREIRPGYVFVENSPMLVGRGLGRVLGDLAALGYAARWNVLSAAAVGALHERERIWITAMLADRDRKRQLQSSGPVGKIRRQARDGGDSVADAEGPRLEGWGADAGRAAQPQSRRDGPTGEGGGDGRLPAAMTPAPPATPNAADTLPHSQP